MCAVVIADDGDMAPGSNKDESDVGKMPMMNWRAADWTSAAAAAVNFNISSKDIGGGETGVLKLPSG